jgi:hypothetical protein
MSSAMETMVAKMLGFTPEQMHETLNGFRDMILTLKGTLERIEQNQAIILAALERNDDGNGIIAHGDRPGDGNDARDGASGRAILTAS